MGTQKRLYLILFCGDINFCAETKQGNMPTCTAPNGVQHTLQGLHRATAGTFGIATGNDNQVLEKLYLDAVFLT